MIKRKIRSIKATDEDWEKLRELAEARNMSMSAYISSLINLKIPKPVPSEEWLKVYITLSEIAERFRTLYTDAQKNGNYDYMKFKEVTADIHNLRKEIYDLGRESWSITEDAGN